MDIVKQELLKKRQRLSEETGGRNIFKRAEIEEKRIQKLREDEKRLCQNPNSSSNPTKFKPAESVTISLPKQEVIRRLRFLKQPVTLFGESDDDRLDRLQAGLFDSDTTENDFLKNSQKSGDTKRRAGEEEEVDDKKNFKLMKTNFSELCDEDKILMFCNNLLTEWNHELDQMTETVKRTAKGKATFATFKQTLRYLNPLFNFCRKKVLPDEIRQALMLVVNSCMNRDYEAANNHYIRIAIGNSAWPIGVTMVGIHERSAREKISTNSVAHVMNDETTRKYLTSVKRLATFCERRHPALPSKALEVNLCLV